MLYLSYNSFQGNFAPGSFFLLGAISECATIFLAGTLYFSATYFIICAVFLFVLAYNQHSDHKGDMD